MPENRAIGRGRGAAKPGFRFECFTLAAPPDRTPV